MDRPQIDRQEETGELAQYFSKFSAALSQLEEELTRWKNYEADYEALKTTLLDLPKETTHNAMVPIGNLAFMPGKLIHTNEVLVMLGDNWFVDRSAVQAAEIVDRRMELVQENITKLKAQEDEIRSKSGIAPGLLGGQEYNEEGLPIVEITEPYYSDDEEDKSNKPSQPGLLPFSQKTPDEQAADRALLDRIAELELEDKENERHPEVREITVSDEKNKREQSDQRDQGDQSDKSIRPIQPGLLPFSQKTPEEQAADRVILDRIAELEREDAERERRREAGEIVTSDEETESDQDEGNYDDDESEDEFRPKALDSDEEYEEEVWEHSGNENEDEEEQEALQEYDPSGKKTVRFADQVTKAMKTGASTHHKPLATSASVPATPAPSTAKPKSPTDLYNQMRARQQAVRSAGSEQMVNMATLESTFSPMMTGGSSRSNKSLVLDTPTKTEAAPLKSALKPPPKKMSLFKQNRAQNQVQEPIKAAKEELKENQEPAPPPAPAKKMSKFAMDRAAAGVANSVSAASTPTPVKPAMRAMRGVSELVVEREVVAPSPPMPKTTPGVSSVVKKNIVSAVHEVTPVQPPIVGVKDVIENTFTKPTKSISAEEPSPSSGRRKKSLFRQQQQQHLEPEPAVPESSFRPDLDSDEEEQVARPKASIPEVVPRSAVKASVLEKATVGYAATSSAHKQNVPAMRTIPAVASSKLRDTALLKGAVIEREDIEPVDEDELEDDMLWRQVVSEYQERRQAMIAKHGAFNREDIERLWEQQVVIPPGMIIPEPQIEVVADRDEGEGEEDDADEEVNDETKEEVVDDRNMPPKKLSLFRAARLTGSLAKQ
ncbi:uri1, prefoldin-like chaperone [Mortierella polycephala]|uniref:Uri1, prefoldin-like chaperone n=1 Tax=Mortierella polycephala TaxID=41804 RepID=A0A9P6TYW1_9FUNG|nr:uri1, prefoldin-like chaperone [Mortierella polycephala]